MARETYFRGSEPIDQRITADCLERVATWLDLADNQVQTALYPEVPSAVDDMDLSSAWMWCALLIANTLDAPTDMLRQLSNAIKIGLGDDAT